MEIITFKENIVNLFKFVIDCTCGFRAFKKELLKKLNFNKFISTHYSITEEILYGCILCKARIKEIPIVFYERSGCKSKLNTKKIFFSLFGILKIRLRGKKILIQKNNKKITNNLSFKK